MVWQLSIPLLHSIEQTFHLVRLFRRLPSYSLLDPGALDSARNNGLSEDYSSAVYNRFIFSSLVKLIRI